MDLLQAFTSIRSCETLFDMLTETLKYGRDPAIAVLALEGLYRIESDVKSSQFPCIPCFGDHFSEKPLIDDIRTVLRKWRCESPLSQAYSGAYRRVPTFLRSLTIFKTFEVPLFIDDYGKKKLLSSYDEKTDININSETPIFHVTHLREAESIMEEKQLKPTDNKNIMKGCWFGLDDQTIPSVYGSRAFKTALSKLGVTCLHQGEIVSYKHEVNVILYAADDMQVGVLKKPTDRAVKSEDREAYVKVSIFVPSRFLPHQDKFDQVFSGPIEVPHYPFCVRAKRLGSICGEMS